MLTLEAKFWYDLIKMGKIFLGLALFLLSSCLNYAHLEKPVNLSGGHVRIYGNPNFHTSNIQQFAQNNCQMHNRVATNFTQAHAGALFSGSEYSYWHYDCVTPTTTVATRPSNETLAARQNQESETTKPKKTLSAKEQEEVNKLSRMNPDDRRAYNCTEKFGFKKGSDKFKDCIFSMYKAETELEKLELQKKLIEANLELARARESASRTEQDRNTALLERQVLAQERAAAAAAQQARIADFESSQRMIDRGLEMLSGQRNLAGQVKQPTTKLEAMCHFNGRFMHCF